MRKILIDKSIRDLKECAYGFPWRHDANCYNFRAPDECVTTDEIDNIEDFEDIENLIIGCDLDDYGFIGKMINLRQLYIYTGENIDSVEFVRTLLKLDYLYIEGSHIDSLDPLIELMNEQKRLLLQEENRIKRLGMALTAVCINSDKELDGMLLKDPGKFASEIIVNGKNIR